MVNLRSRVTRLGVLDIGSNTIHMLIVDAAPGARPDPEASTKSTVRLMQYVKDDGSIKKSGIEAILTAVDQCMELAEEYDITQLLAMATSAIKEAPNSNKILRKIEERIGQSVTVLSGTDEARLTFLAARRVPQIQASGACRGHVKDVPLIGTSGGRGAAPVRARGHVDHDARAAGGLDSPACGHEPEQRVALPGITPERTMQIVGGGIVADEIMRSLNVHEVEICPWALREGAILRWLDQFGRTRLGF